MLKKRITVSPMFAVPRIKTPARRATTIFTLGEVARLQALPSPDGGLFAIMFGSGIRRAEARRLRREHIDLPRQRLRVVDGKGGKDRDVALTPVAARRSST
jgi:integrase